MTNINITDLQNMCRTCMFNCDLKFPQNNIISDVYYKLTNIHFERNDELPQQICRKCFEKINEIYTFALQCKQTHSSLIICLNNLKNKQLKQMNDVNLETNESVKIKEEVTIEEHKIEFVEVEEFSSTNDKLKIKEEIKDDADNELSEEVPLDVTDFNKEQNINYFESDLLQPNTVYNSDDEDEPFETPPAARKKSDPVILDLLPEKSRKIYEAEYTQFMEWCKRKRVTTINEAAMLAYLGELSKKYKNSSLWSKFSMLKAVLHVRKHVDVSKFKKLKTFLKKHGSGYAPKKSKVFERADIESFLEKAPNGQFLMMKVALILGLAGACRREELYNMKTKHIERKESALVVTIPDAKTQIERVVTLIKGSRNSPNPLEIYDKFAALRPPHINHDSFFIQYHKEKCSIQRVGINQFSKIPSLIAKHLKLPTPECYTGHAFRRSSASLLSGADDDILSVRRHGDWKSSTVTEGYSEDNLETKAGTSKNMDMEVDDDNLEISIEQVKTEN